MSEPIYRRWNPPVTSEIEDIHGWLVDLDAAKSMFERLANLLDQEDAEPLLIDALATAALIRYGRCFTSGIRKRLSLALLPNAADDEVDLHERMKSIRDWYVAHAINRQEAHGLYVIVSPDPSSSSPVLGFSSQSTAELPLSPPEVASAGNLCRRWIIALEAKLAHENLRLRPYVNELTHAQLLALPTGEPETDSNIRSRRQQPKR